MFVGVVVFEKKRFQEKVDANVYTYKGAWHMDWKIKILLSLKEEDKEEDLCIIKCISPIQMAMYIAISY
jgi:hypothetical protein